MIPKITDPCGREVDVEICFVCKKCRMAFAGESQLLIHQRQCYSSNQENRGAFRIVQTGHECKTCNNGEKYKTAVDFKRHLDGEAHLRCRGKTGALPPPESPLSHEMEDVVNQITLLAARAAQESSPGVDFDAKRRMLAPQDGLTGH